MTAPPPKSERVKVSGRVTVVQEQRFHLIMDDGRGLLLTLSARAPVSTDDLQRFRQAQERIRVEYSGDPGLASAVAHSVCPV